MRCFSIRTHALSLLFCLTGTVFAQAQWQPLNEPFGTNIQGLFESNGTALASSPTGIYRSDNHGMNWSHAYTGNASPSFARIGSRLYASTWSDIIVSDNDGQSWEQLQTNLPESNVSALAYDGSTLYAGGFGLGIYSSTDNGATWQSNNEGLPNDYVVSIAVIDTSVFINIISSFGAEDGGIYTREAGGNWIRISSTTMHPSLLKAIGSVLFIAGWNEAYRSEDLGHTWIPLASPTSQSYISCVESSGSLLFAGTSDNGVFSSTDNGATWSPAGLEFTGITSLTASSSMLIAGTTKYGAYISHDNGAHWEAVNTGIASTTTVPVLAADNSGIYAAVENSTNIYKSSDNGISWVELPAPHTTSSTITALAVANSTLLAGTSMEGVFNADVDGTLWQASTGIPKKIWVTNFLQSGSLLLAGTMSMSFPVAPYSGAYISNDIGITWTATDLPTSALSLVQHNGALYAGTTTDVRVSTDGGTHWVRSSPASIAESEIYSLASNGATLFAGSYNNGIFISHNNGITWTPSTMGLPENIRVTRFAVYEQTVFAGTEDGVFKTTDNGTTWESVTDGMEHIPVQTIVIQGDYLYAGTTGAATWRRPLSELVITSVNESTPVQSGYELFPNPMKTAATLRLCASCELHNATLSITTVAGQHVRSTHGLYGSSITIQRGELAPGVYAFTLEEHGTRLTSGTFVVE